ncbi:shikimate kinase [Jannaschia ovalis]|uniref:Shikimate kinase n=1 Tax=Jannaschia ovalis TaxID=3038773 RepID=A0ABY8LAQ1_9RHOB|nr:shikimate kinase [Jannaschia sp. GRR-S6-38]WGH78414.1 shikimate kinase [Jannaschia sp. GRR-S6-38]
MMGENMPSAAEAGLTRPVVLVGMMGCGKTAVGTALAERLGVPFRDTDAAMETAARMSIPEIFARDGEAFFRRRETEVLKRLLAEGPGVLSTGGGAFLRPENRAAIAAAGLSVWLKADAELLWNRVRHKTTRPLLLTDDPKATLIRLLAEREPSYAQAELVVEADPAFSIAQMVDRVLRALRRAGVVT